MPYRNRVTPFGEIVALPGRGMFTGNRGVLHNDAKEIIRQYQSRRWLTCLLEYKNLKRPIMQPHRWTQLFFLDEAAALGAGHRPCAYCRRADYVRFKALWAKVFGTAGADEMDAALHKERVHRGRKVTYPAELASLPNATYVAIDGRAWLVWNQHLYAWSDSGYAAAITRPSRWVDVLTPRSIVRVLSAGYSPQVHGSLEIEALSSC